MDITTTAAAAAAAAATTTTAAPIAASAPVGASRSPHPWPYHEAAGPDIETFTAGHYKIALGVLYDLVVPGGSTGIRTLNPKSKLVRGAVKDDKGEDAPIPIDAFAATWKNNIMPHRHDNGGPNTPLLDLIKGTRIAADATDPHQKTIRFMHVYKRGTQNVLEGHFNGASTPDSQRMFLETHEHEFAEHTQGLITLAVDTLCGAKGMLALPKDGVTAAKKTYVLGEEVLCSLVDVFPGACLPLLVEWLLTLAIYQESSSGTFWNPSEKIPAWGIGTQTYVKCLGQCMNVLNVLATNEMYSYAGCDVRTLMIQAAACYSMLMGVTGFRYSDWEADGGWNFAVLERLYKSLVDKVIRWHKADELVSYDYEIAFGSLGFLVMYAARLTSTKPRNGKRSTGEISAEEPAPAEPTGSPAPAKKQARPRPKKQSTQSTPPLPSISMYLSEEEPQPQPQQQPQPLPVVTDVVVPVAAQSVAPDDLLTAMRALVADAQKAQANALAREEDMRKLREEVLKLTGEDRRDREEEMQGMMVAKVTAADHAMNQNSKITRLSAALTHVERILNNGESAENMVNAIRGVIATTTFFRTVKV